jgi:hypothetical protein
VCNRDEAERGKAEHDNSRDGRYRKKLAIIESNPRCCTKGKKSGPDEQGKDKVSSGAEEAL